MVGPCGRLRHHHVDDAVGDVNCPRRLAMLVGHDVYRATVRDQAKNGVDEVGAAPAVQPRCPQDPRPVGQVRPHRPLAGCLGSPVSRPGGDHGVLRVGLVGVAGEDVVGRDVQQRRPEPAQARASVAGPTALAAKAAASLPSAPSTSVQAAQLTTTSTPASAAVTPAGSVTSRSDRVATQTASSGTLPASTATRSVASSPPPPVMSHVVMSIDRSDGQGRARLQRLPPASVVLEPGDGLDSPSGGSRPVGSSRAHRQSC